MYRGNVGTLGKCHGSHSKDRKKNKYNDKYMGKTKTDKDKNVGK